MTREEAISEWTFRSNHIKKWLDEYGEEPSIRHYVELIDMAIEALTEPRGDQISRSRLFNKLATVQAPPEANEYKAEVYKIIQSMGTEENDDK